MAANQSYPKFQNFINFIHRLSDLVNIKGKCRSSVWNLSVAAEPELSGAIRSRPEPCRSRLEPSLFGWSSRRSTAESASVLLYLLYTVFTINSWHIRFQVCHILKLFWIKVSPHRENYETIIILWILQLERNTAPGCCISKILKLEPTKDGSDTQHCSFARSGSTI